MRDQATAFDDARNDQQTIRRDRHWIDLDGTFDRIPNAIDPSIISMEDFETVGFASVCESIGGELSAFEGTFGRRWHRH